jgi:hypothetical protein
MSYTEATAGRTRPLCEYPAYPKYNSSRDIGQAASFSCTMPDASIRMSALVQNGPCANCADQHLPIREAVSTGEAISKCSPIRLLTNITTAGPAIYFADQVADLSRVASEHRKA